jgi:hypothetical protein
VLPALLAVGALVAPEPARALPAERAVIVVIDGARRSETLDAPGYPWTPRIGLDLLPLGAHPVRFVDIGITNTVPGHASLLTGVPEALANDGGERPHHPTVFEYWRAATGRPASDAWVVVNKTKLAVLAHSDHPAFGAAYAASETTGIAGDEATMLAAIGILQTRRPALLLVSLADTDGAGHVGDWTLYLGAIRRADSLVGVLWDVIQADPALAPTTALVVTNDHGRHDDAHGGFRNHGDGCAGCREIVCVMAGAGVRAGYASPAVRSQHDLGPTLGALLGFPTPLAAGVPMTDLLVGGDTTLTAPPDPLARRLAVRLASANPCRGPVRLAVDVPEAGPVTVEVVDVSGRRRARLYEGHAAAGALALAWDGRDSDRGAAAPGLHWIVARSGRERAASRVIRLP